MEDEGASGLGLSSEEPRILALVLAGYKIKDIARQLSLSERTVCRRVVGVAGKLGVCNKIGLALFLIDRQRFAGA